MYSRIPDQTVNLGEQQMRLNELSKKDLKRMGAAALLGLASYGALNYSPKKQTSPVSIEQTAETIDPEQQIAEVYEELGDPELKAQDAIYPEYYDYVEKYCDRLDPNFIEQVMYAESRGGQNMKFDKNGRGIMQVSDIALKDYNKKNISNYTIHDLKDPGINIKIGCWYLNWIAKRLAANEQAVTPENIYLAYNVGMTNFLHHKHLYFSGINPKTGKKDYNGMTNFYSFEGLHESNSI